MKNKNILNLFLIVASISYCFGQTYSIEYRLKVHKNRKDLQGVSKFTQDVFDTMDSLTFNFKFNSEKSILKPNPLTHQRNTKIPEAATVLTFGVTNTYFHDYKQQEYLQLRIHMGSSYLVLCDEKQYLWEYKDEYKNILGYKCQKVKTSKKILNRHGILESIPIIAWYTKELPFPFPFKDYFGLEGLVLELHEGTNRFSYHATQVVGVSADKIELVYDIPKKAERILESDYEIISNPMKY